MRDDLEYLELLHIISGVSSNKVVSNCLAELRRYHEPTFIHSLHVATLAVQIGYEYGLSYSKLRTLAHGALLHDIGKKNVPIAVMCKEGALTDDEFSIIKTHPVVAHEVVKGLKFNYLVKKSMVRKICLLHHYKMDGSGYPSCEQLKTLCSEFDCSRIPVECRIVTVCDIYDALIEKRPYKKCFSHIEALSELDRMVLAGQIDGDVVSILKCLIDENRLLLQTSSLDMRYA